MSASLRHATRAIRLPHDVNVVGRDPSTCDVVLEDERVSQQHALIARDGGRWLALDYKSSFGLRVNGATVQRATLVHGDRLDLGGLELTFELTDPAREQAPTSLSQALATPVSSSLSASPLAVKLASLIRIGRELNEELNLDRLLYTLIDRALFVVNADRGMLLLAHADTGKLDPWLYRSRGEDRAFKSGPIVFSRSITDLTATTRKPVLSADALADPRFRAATGDEPSSIKVQNIRSAISVPLVHKERFLGVLYVDTQLGGVRFTQDDLDLLAAFADHAAIALENAALYRVAYTDELTGCYVRRYFDRRLREARRPVSVLLVDLDHFKKINDAYGHAAGDAVLQQVAKVVRKAVRGVDVVARFGGEEFVILFPGQDSNQCTVPAERIRRAVEAGTFAAAGHAIRCTVSMGLATAHGSTDVVRAADDALYRAKASGRNRLCVAEVDA